MLRFRADRSGQIALSTPSGRRSNMNAFFGYLFAGVVYTCVTVNLRGVLRQMNSFQNETELLTQPPGKLLWELEGI